MWLKGYSFGQLEDNEEASCIGGKGLTLIDSTSKHRTDYKICDPLGRNQHKNRPDNSKLLTETREREFRLLNTSQKSRDFMIQKKLPSMFDKSTWVSVACNQIMVDNVCMRC